MSHTSCPESIACSTSCTTQPAGSCIWLPAALNTRNTPICPRCKWPTRAQPVRDWRQDARYGSLHAALPGPCRGLTSSTDIVHSTCKDSDEGVRVKQIVPTVTPLLLNAGERWQTLVGQHVWHMLTRTTPHAECVSQQGEGIRQRNPIRHPISEQINGQSYMGIYPIACRQTNNSNYVSMITSDVAWCRQWFLVRMMIIFPVSGSWWW